VLVIKKSRGAREQDIKQPVFLIKSFTKRVNRESR
jgi:hypothetical protein